MYTVYVLTVTDYHLHYKSCHYKSRLLFHNKLHLCHINALRAIAIRDQIFMIRLVTAYEGLLEICHLDSRVF